MYKFLHLIQDLHKVQICVYPALCFERPSLSESWIDLRTVSLNLIYEMLVLFNFVITTVQIAIAHLVLFFLRLSNVCLWRCISHLIQVYIRQHIRYIEAMVV